MVLSQATDSQVLVSNYKIALGNIAGLYQAMLGCALYASVRMRPDISERCGKLAKFSINPSEIHKSSILVCTSI
jgi:hypothetical protein